MKPVFSLIILTFFFLFYQGRGQSIDQSPIYSQLDFTKYISAVYENDFFGSTDRFYTQGIKLENVNPVFKSNPLNILLVRPKSYQVSCGLSLEHTIFTPSDIQDTGLRINDRPYAACLMVSSFMVSSLKEKGVQITSSLTAGVIGHLANGDCMQIYFHKWTHDIRQPKGWDSQIKNDLIINYQINYDKEVFSINNFLSGFYSAEITAGTLYDRLGAGFSFITDGFNEFAHHLDFTALNRLLKKYESMSLYLYVHPFVQFIGYNATMQGGFLQKENPYVLENKEISRILVSNRFGMVFKVRKTCVEYFHVIQSREYKSGLPHRYGGIKFTLGF